jgi:hypothetical protein
MAGICLKASKDSMHLFNAHEELVFLHHLWCYVGSIIGERDSTGNNKGKLSPMQAPPNINSVKSVS